MILVDANVVIAYLKKPDPKVLGLFQTHQAAVCGITRAEVLHGATFPPFVPIQVIVHRITSRGQLKRTGNVSPAPRLTSNTAPPSAKRSPCHR